MHMVFVLRVHPLPSHGLKDRLSQVIGGHDNISGIVRATPGKDGMHPLSGFSLLQRPVTQVHKELNIRELHLSGQCNGNKRQMKHEKRV